MRRPCSTERPPAPSTNDAVQPSNRIGFPAAKDADNGAAVAGSAAYTFADGRRNAWEVYEAVAAEALSAGEWYYGTVKPADVLRALEKAAEAGAFTVRAAK